MSDQNIAGQDPDMSGSASGEADDRGPGGMPLATEAEKGSDKSGTESMDDDDSTTTS